MVKNKQRAISQARIVLGLSGRGLTEEGKTSCYWQRGLELFLIRLLTNLPPGDVTKQAKTPSHQNRLKFQAVFSKTALTLKGHYHIYFLVHFPVLFQP